MRTFSLFLLILIFQSCALNTEDQIRTAMEANYLKAQIDSQEGKLKIEKDSLGVWKFKESPYDNGRQPKYLTLKDYEQDMGVKADLN